jgi:CheY-like chemotaxis protein
MKGKCILIIDDHLDTCEALCAMIKRRGGEPECAVTLKEGIILERVKRETGNPYDCIVSDLGFPQSDAENTIDVLRGFISNGIPVRALSGASDPAVIAACHDAGIKLILKGTPAEGIMESILYAIAENADTGIEEVAEDIVENRQVVREIPQHVAAWFFWRWPVWGQITATVGTVTVVCGTLISISAAVIKKVDARAVADEAARTVIAQSSATTKKVETHDIQIRELQDDRIRIFEQLKNQSASLGRIEDKLDNKK